MPDTPVEPNSAAPYDPRLELRVSRLEADVRELREIAQSIARIEAVLPHLATKADVAELRAELRAELAEKPSRTYLWGVMTALITAYAAGIAIIAVLR